LYTSPYALAVLENNPHIDNLVVQEKDIIAITELGTYFDYIKTKYLRFVDLCESIEGSMLKLESRHEFYMPKEWRDRTCADNYYRKTMRLGGHPTDRQTIVGKFYCTKHELAAAKAEYDRLAEGGTRFVWGWALHGTSHHKCYPLMQPLLHEYLDANPTQRVVLLGGSEHRNLQFEHPQVVGRAGDYNIRQLIGVIGQLDAIVSPESFIANAAAAWNKPVITLLSHSSRENLCATWLHDYSLEPSHTIAPCFPCHQLHYTPSSCPQREIIDTDTDQVIVAGAACTTGAISMEALAARMVEIYGTFGPTNKSNP
jgi:ADP-heptose:LPS heptosyltransferase